jgi:hypothetical protein
MGVGAQHLEEGETGVGRQGQADEDSVGQGEAAGIYGLA